MVFLRFLFKGVKTNISNLGQTGTFGGQNTFNTNQTNFGGMSGINTGQQINLGQNTGFGGIKTNTNIQTNIMGGSGIPIQNKVIPIPIPNKKELDKGEIIQVIQNYMNSLNTTHPNNLFPDCSFN